VEVLFEVGFIYCEQSTTPWSYLPYSIDHPVNSSWQEGGAPFVTILVNACHYMAKILCLNWGLTMGGSNGYCWQTLSFFHPF
jgi:hypothetical protein